MYAYRINGIVRAKELRDRLNHLAFLHYHDWSGTMSLFV